jgi:hypothetical protein
LLKVQSSYVCFCGWVICAGLLTALQLGLSNVDDLAPLGKPPQLQVTVVRVDVNHLAPLCVAVLGNGCG